jgi:hypothetical protein
MTVMGRQEEWEDSAEGLSAEQVVQIGGTGMIATFPALRPNRNGSKFQMPAWKPFVTARANAMSGIFG